MPAEGTVKRLRSQIRELHARRASSLTRSGSCVRELDGANSAADAGSIKMQRKNVAARGAAATTDKTASLQPSSPSNTKGAEAGEASASTTSEMLDEKTTARETRTESQASAAAYWAETTAELPASSL